MFYIQRLLVGFSFLFCFSLLLGTANGAVVTPNYAFDDYFEDGDLILGALLPLRLSSKVPCDGPLVTPAIQILHVIRYVLNRTNENPNILPNVTVGLAALSDCYRTNIAVVKATQFIPSVGEVCLANEEFDFTENSSLGLRPSYPVFGILGSFASAKTAATASLLGSYSIPQMDSSSTSDDLSDKVKYPFFSRTVPPDRFQAKALVDLMVYFGWSYISTVNVNEIYGQNAMRHITTFTREVGICIAYNKELSADSKDHEYDEVVTKLVENSKARVIVTFVFFAMQRKLHEALIRADKIGQFIFLSTDSFRQTVYSGLEPSFIGTFATQLKTGWIQDFKSFYSDMSPWKEDHSSPWFGFYSKSDCIHKFGLDACNNFTTVQDFPDFYWSSYYAPAADVVLAFVNSLHEFIKDHCQEFVGDRDALRACYDGKKYLSYVRAVNFDGFVSTVKFDENGDILGGYDITYFGRNSDGGYDNKKIGNWSRDGTNLIINEDLIQWYGLDSQVLDSVPESVCAKPCSVGEFYLKGELECCWECRRCRDNERIRDDYDGCEVCPEFFWPDEDNLTTCQPITPTFLKWSDSLAIGLESLSATGLFMCLLITFVFLRHKDKKVIRGSSRELMTPITLGLFVAFLTVYLFIASPQSWVCYLNYCGFHLSCTFIFGPLFLKTLRIYRIFAAAERCERRPSFVNTSSQVIMVFTIIMIQAVIMLSLSWLNPPVDTLKMPVATVKYVEHLCEAPLQNLFGPLSFNLLLLLLCAVFGFLTRQLPDNFNESWYIFISVSTTLFVWAAFLSTFMLAFYAYHKATLLSLVLILNAVATVTCLHVPKIYAVYFVEETKIKTTNFDSLDFSVSETSVGKASTDTERA